MATIVARHGHAHCIPLPLSKQLYINTTTMSQPPNMLPKWKYCNPLSCKPAYLHRVFLETDLPFLPRITGLTQNRKGTRPQKQTDNSWCLQTGPNQLQHQLKCLNAGPPLPDPHPLESYVSRTETVIQRTYRSSRMLSTISFYLVRWMTTIPAPHAKLLWLQS